MGPGGVNDVMHRKHGLRILGIWEKSELSFCLRKRRLTFGARRGLAMSTARGGGGGGGGGRWKSQHRKFVYHSPYVENHFNSKVIKSFVPELRSRKVFRVSGFLCYLYMSYEHSMYISHIQVWLCSIVPEGSFSFMESVKRTNLH